MLKAFLAAYARRRFASLFASLLLTIGLLPVFRALVPGGNILEALLAVNLVAAIASVGREQRTHSTLIGVGVAYLGVRALQAVLGVAALLPVSEGLWIGACVVAMATTARYAFRPGSVDAERIFAALDAYLLAGLTFGVGYWLIETSLPGSFRGSAPQLGLDDSIYFSFVTIATLGYGDIVPVSGPARALTILEAVGGQMYLAVLVARLVSLHATRGPAD
ncbi:MAG TPA: potassium channel family protein [Vicinamibacteria bacterium]|nr:potassium channel family protein [Vicinamibacteria bacterium]